MGFHVDGRGGGHTRSQKLAITLNGVRVFQLNVGVNPFEASPKPNVNVVEARIFPLIVEALSDMHNCPSR